MTGIDNWASLRAACEKYGATSVTVPALVAAFEARGPGMSGDTGDTPPCTCDSRRPHWHHAALAAVLAAERERGAAEAVQAVRAQYEGYLHSDNLDPAWIAGWHSAINHAAAALRAVLPPESEGPGPEEEEA